ncbi:hypothetical protein LCGC14_0108850 [marine sediment metagenome]
MMNLQHLLPEWQGAPIEVSGLSVDSRQVRPGDVFLALPGLRSDGRAHIEQAIEAGAVAIVYEAGDGKVLRGDVPMVPVDGLAARLSEIGGRFHGEPSETLGLIGITGTNGKTSVSHMLACALNSLGQSCGVIGTLGSGMPGQLLDHGMTTPDALLVQQQLGQLRDAGARWVSMEVSSHALDQGRVAALNFELGVFTNLSRDHLDYHGDMASYGAAKARLFQFPLRAAVINLDDAFGRELITASKTEVFAYSVENSDADLYCTNVRYDSEGISAQINFRQQQASLRSPLLGSFNLSNLLAVTASLLMLEVTLERAAELACSLQPPAGRMQRLGGNGRPLVVIDYAHTPDALEKALAALRAHVKGRLTCLFGCGGDRDNGKRPLMGRIAEQAADRVVITDDNPRTEPSSSIIEQICTGIEQVRKITVLANRAEAIDYTINRAHQGDVILIAGKGHETYQEIDGVRHPFSDIEQAERALQNWEPSHA